MMTDKEVSILEALIRTGNELAAANFAELSEDYNIWRLKLTMFLSDQGLTECGADLSYAAEFESLRKTLSVIAEYHGLDGKSTEEVDGRSG